MKSFNDRGYASVLCYFAPMLFTYSLFWRFEVHHEENLRNGIVEHFEPVGQNYFNPAAIRFANVAHE